MAKELVLRAVAAFMARDLDGDVTATRAGSGVPIDQTYWLGARVEAAKITFFGFFRTEPDALEAVR